MNKMNVLIWIPQLKSNNMSIESTNRIKPKLLTALQLNYISTKQGNFKIMKQDNFKIMVYTLEY